MVQPLIPTRLLPGVFFLLALSSAILGLSESLQTQIRIEPDGGYTGIVIKINKDVPQDLCPKILSNIKVSKKYSIPVGLLSSTKTIGWEKSLEFLVLQMEFDNIFPIF